VLTSLQRRKLIKLFSMYDADKSGVLTLKDFENVVNQLGRIRNWSSRSIKCMTLTEQYKRKWQQLLGAANQNKDKKIDLQEWLRYHDHLLSDKEKYRQEAEALMHLVFEVFDKNGDGQISVQEWQEFLRTYNVSPVYAQELVFPKLDQDNDGFLTPGQLIQYLHDFYFSDDPEAPGNYMFGPY